MRVLLVEDEPKMSAMLKRSLCEEGYEPVIAGDGAQGLTCALDGRFDLILLDAMLPKLDGFEFARRYRSQGGTSPILMLTSRDGAIDQIKGLDAGADDYLTKPFRLDVLLARMRALTRRFAPPPNELRAGHCRIDLESREVFVNERPVSLSKTEFTLLAALARQAGRVVTREALIEAVWGPGRSVESNTLDTFIHLLRGKVGGGSSWIENVRGVGYLVRRGDL
jgi:DNA-binding response OmpR family regulator